ncbi:MAG: 1,4-dihydroxy-6-naphthoate synthase [Chitinophagaceae bacterium]|nr:1,4-dihydroxy-6-naphthoate synthase [Chitinophagaceae bacterium]
MKLTLGFSPCPNDTFIFDALVNKKIDTGNFEFEPILEDVETLNQWALEGKLDITKLSFPAFFRSLDKYVLLKSGSALGNGVGPLLIATEAIPRERVNGLRIALPGVNTTANLLFNYAFPDANRRKFMLFSEIEDAIMRGKAELGVIIHENRFTYQQKGLVKILDLGEYWEEKTRVPIPLGGIAANRSLDPQVSQSVDQLIRKSLEFAFGRYPIVAPYVKQHSHSMSEDVMRKHIDLYVNDFSIELGEKGRGAVETLYKVFKEQPSLSVTSTSSSEMFLS